MFVSKIPKGTVVIDESNWQRYAHRNDVSTGYAGRDWKANPYASSPYSQPFDYPVIDRSEWTERIKDQEKYESGITAVAKRHGVQFSYQNGVGYCWIFAVAKIVEFSMAMAGQPYVPLSPASIGCKIKNFRNQGGTLHEGLDYAVKHGFGPTRLWPEYALSRKYDTEEVDAERHKGQIKEWTDVVDWGQVSKREGFERIMTLGLMTIPYAIAVMWWRHAIAGASPVVLGRNDFGIQLWNSHGEGKPIILHESKASPDEAVAVRVSSAA